jgi:hypothetical protein
MPSCAAAFLLTVKTRTGSFSMPAWRSSGGAEVTERRTEIEEDDPYGWEEMLVIFQRAVRKLPNGELTTVDPYTGR